MFTLVIQKKRLCGEQMGHLADMAFAELETIVED